MTEIDDVVGSHGGWPIQQAMRWGLPEDTIAIVNRPFRPLLIRRRPTFLLTQGVTDSRHGGSGHAAVAVLEGMGGLDRLVPCPEGIQVFRRLGCSFEMLHERRNGSGKWCDVGADPNPHGTPFASEVRW